MHTITGAELLAVGTELLLGEIVDTNTAYLARSLAEQGIDVYWSARVGDNLKRARTAIEAAFARSQLLVVCGGLGPTGDDLTREAIAQALGEEPVVDPQLESDLRAFFESRGRRMPAMNSKQAWLIPSAEPLPNPLGTAPGWLVRTEWQGHQRWLVALPGPPQELRRMWLSEALPRLPLARASLRSITLKTHGAGESTIAELLDRLTDSPNPTVATYAKADGVHVRIAAKHDDEESARYLAEQTARRVNTLLDGLVWGRDEESLPGVVAWKLGRSGARVAIYEGPAAGALATAFSSVSGGPDALAGSVVAWAPQTMAALGLPEPTTEAGDISGFSAKLAEAVRHTFAALVGVAVIDGGTPVAERYGQPTDEAVVAVYADGTAVVERISRLPVEGVWRRERIVNFALHLLRSHLP